MQSFHYNCHVNSIAHLMSLLEVWMKKNGNHTCLSSVNIIVAYQSIFSAWCYQGMTTGLKCSTDKKLELELSQHDFKMKGTQIGVDMQLNPQIGLAYMTHVLYCLVGPKCRNCLLSAWFMFYLYALCSLDFAQCKFSNVKILVIVIIIAIRLLQPLQLQKLHFIFGKCVWNKLIFVT